MGGVMSMISRKKPSLSLASGCELSIQGSANCIRSGGRWPMISATQNSINPGVWEHDRRYDLANLFIGSGAQHRPASPDAVSRPT